MGQVTIRQVEAAWVATAKEIATENGVSMNSVLVAALKRGLEVEGKTRATNLDKFAGDSPTEFGVDWDKAMAVFETLEDET
jgi:hypothetical protein